MASSGSKKTVEKAIKAEVKKEVKKEEKKKHKGKEKKGSYKKIKQEIKKEVRKQEQGPKPKFSVTVTATLGQIDGNPEHGPTLKMATFLHPSLCKGPDDDKAFGPLQAAAAQYGQWCCKKAHVRLTPLVGGSAVSGTVLRISANLTQTPGSSNWGGLGARKHKDFQIGKAGSFMLTRQDLAGPRAGGWWNTDTNVEGNQSAGPVLEVHALGTSQSTYKDALWEGPLAIVEITGKWEFTNYNNNPAMGALERHESKVENVKIGTDSDGAIQLKLPTESPAARFMDDPTVHRVGVNNSGSQVGETIYQVVDTGAKLVGDVAPPPFNWLIKGGWWFLKKVIGRAGKDSGEDTFLVYPSLGDAQNNKPAISSSLSMVGQPVTTNLQITQMNAPNMGGSSSVVQLRGGGALPLMPSGTPPTSFYLHGKFKLVFHHNTPTQSTVNCPFTGAASVNQSGGSVNNWYPALHFLVAEPVVYTTDGVKLTHWCEPPTQRLATLNLDKRCLVPQPAYGKEFEIDVYAHRGEPLGVQSGEAVYLHSILWKPKNYTTNQWITPDTADMFFFNRVGDTIDITLYRKTGDVSTTQKFETGQWYYSLFLVKGRSSLSDIKNGKKLDNAVITPSTDTQMSALLPFLVQKHDDSAVFVVEMDTSVHKKLSKVERLATALGITLEDSSSDESEYDTDDAEDFENVTETGLQQRIENLMLAGLSHEKAVELAKQL